MLLLDYILRFSAAGMLLPSAVLLLRAHGDNRIIQLGAAFMFGLVAYFFCSMPDEPFGPLTWKPAIAALCVIHPALLWGFARALFEDGRPIMGKVAIAAAMLELSYLLPFLDFVPLDSTNASYFRAALSIGLFGHALYIALRGRMDDLIESRRQFRMLFVVLAGLYGIVQNGFEVFFASTTPPQILSLFNVATIWVLTLFLLPKLLALRPEQLFLEQAAPAPSISPAPGAVSPANQSMHAALVQYLEEGHGYREPGLSIVGLAEHLGTQEHRLRRLINQDLGYRNFRDFMNTYRLEEVRTRLSDPDEAHIPVLTIAMDAGFQSLGPFNRAFKEVEGRTPTEFRAGALASAQQG